jgi:hypothetical protein
VTYRVEDEPNDMPCGFDYESFIDGFWCETIATKVVIEGRDFHFAHLCELHTQRVMELVSQ